MTEGYYPKRTTVSLSPLWHNLIKASHILHRNGILDAYGHVSVRNPDNPSTFYLPRNMAPALLSTVDDIVEYKVEDGSPVEGDKAPEGYVERFVHSEVYKKLEGVNAIVHSHAREVVAFSIVDEKECGLKAVTHMAGFLGPSVPTWDISSAYSSVPSLTTSKNTSPHDLLVRTIDLGHSLSAAFKPSSSTSFLYSALHSALPSQITSHAPKPDPSKLPMYPVVLMRGHGFATCAASLEEVVYQAIYTVENARVQKDAIALSSALRVGKEEEGKVEGKIVGITGGGEAGGTGSGKISGGKWKTDGTKQHGDGVKGLSERECADAWESNKASLKRAWALWCREVEVSPLYKNEVNVDD